MLLMDVLRDPECYYITDSFDIVEPVGSKAILIASCRDSNYKVFSKTAKKYYMSPWDMEELTLYNDGTGQLEPETLLDRYELFGGIPRSIFKNFSIKPEKALRMHCDVVAKFLSLIRCGDSSGRADLESKSS